MTNNQKWFNKKYPKESKEIEIEYEVFEDSLVIEDYLNLKDLYLHDVQKTDKIILKNLSQLQECTIWDCGLQDLVIENCPQLKKLDVRKNFLADLEFLEGLKNLEELKISGNPEIALDLKYLPKSLKNLSLLELSQQKYADLKKFFRKTLSSLSQEAKQELVNNLDKETKRRPSIPVEPGKTQELMSVSREVIENVKEINKQLKDELIKSKMKLIETKKDQLEKMKNEFVEKRLSLSNDLISRFNENKKEEKIQKIRDNLDIYLDFVNSTKAKELARKYLLKGEKEDSDLARLLSELCEKKEEIQKQNVVENPETQLVGGTQVVNREIRNESENKKTLEFRDKASRTQVGMQVDPSTKFVNFGVTREKKDVTLNIYDTQQQKNELTESIEKRLIDSQLQRIEQQSQIEETKQEQQSQILQISPPYGTPSSSK